MFYLTFRFLLLLLLHVKEFLVHTPLRGARVWVLVVVVVVVVGPCYNIL